MARSDHHHGDPMTPIHNVCAALFLVGMAFVVPCFAQGARPATPAELALQRAQRLAGDGDVPGAQAIADSVLAGSADGSATYVEALYRRATFAESADAARRDYLRVAVEYSLSPRAEDALLRLAQLEMTRGDRSSAKRYLERLAIEHADGRLRAQGAYWMGRALLEEGALPQACASLADAKARTAASDVEMMNQISYYSRPCAGLPVVDSVANKDTSAKIEDRKAKSGDRAVTDASSKGPAWSAQVAAYSGRKDADRLAKKLKARGLDARVTATAPYRVRVGRFVKRSEAVAVVEKLRGQKTSAIVVEAERP